MRKPGAITLALTTGALAAISGTGVLFVTPPCNLHIILIFFQDHLREPLFVGLLTVSAFLFSLKTFIIVTMKENVYDTESYYKKYLEHKELNKSLKRYGALQNFALLLFLSVLISLISAVIQFTLGLIDEPYAAIFCISFSLWSISMIFISLLNLQLNLRSWFRFLNED